MTLFLFIILGAAWRVWDGTGLWLRGGYRVAIGGLITFAAVYLNIRPEGIDAWAWSIIASLFIVWALARGYRDWTNWSNLLQYAPAPAAGFMIASQTGDVVWLMVYVALSLVAGAAHPIISRFNWHTRYAEAVVGACLIGGASPW